jgi:phosphate-selective porin OprO and OprP
MTRWMLHALAGTALTVSAAAAQEPADLSRSYAAELLADAQGRTSALAQQDRAFTAKVGGQIMFRYVYNSASELPGDEDVAVGFQARRTKIAVSGNVIDENWSYQVQMAFSRSSGTPALENAFIRRKLDSGWYVQAGQFKLPFLREELVSSSRQLAADRSVMNNFFTQAYSQGVEVGMGGSGDDAFRFTAAFSDGLRSSNTDIGASPADYALTARGEYKLAGDWKQFAQFTSFQNSDFGALLGGAVHWQSGGDTAGTPDADLLGATADVSIVGNGWNAYAAGVWAQSDMPGADFDDFGFVVQGGIFVAESTELFARYDAIIADDDHDLDDFHAITAGVNHYLVPSSHAAKLTADVQYLLDTPSESLIPSASSMRGLGLNAADTDDGQWTLRLQMQLLF